MHFQKFEPIISPRSKNESLIYPQTMDLLICTILLVGLLSVASSSFTWYDDQFSLFSFWENSASIFKRQLVYASIGLVVYYLIPKLVSMSFLYHHRFKIAIASVVLCTLVFTPLGVEINYKRRWVDLFVQFQPSEVAKIGMILFIATFLENKQEDVRSGVWWVTPVKMAFILSCFLIPIILQDLSTSVIFMIIALAMLTAAGYRLNVLVLFALVLAFLAFVMIFVFEYRVERLDFLYPWEDSLNRGYQTMQAQLAQEIGGWFGQGYGMSIQKLGNLPVPHNDFILSIMIEEWGMVPVLAFVLYFYTALIYLILKIAQAGFYKGHIASSYFCYGVATWLFFQSAFNLFVNLGVVPVTGLNLPLVSYGGTSMVVTLLALALVKKINIEIYETKPTSSRFREN